MRAILTAVILVAVLPYVQARAEDPKATTPDVKEEIRKLHEEYRESGSKRDRAALERIFAEGYVWVQGNGRVISRSEHIESIVGNPSPFGLPPLSLDEITSYGDTAIVRGRESRSDLFATTVFVRRNGRWQYAHAQGTLLPRAPKAVDLDPKVLDRFVGRYEFGPDAVATVTREGDALFWKGGRRPQVKLLPLSESHFVVEDGAVGFVFHGTPRATHVTMRIGVCQESQARRIE